MSAPATQATGTPGELDPSFGEAGKVQTPVGPGDDRIDAMAIDSQGRIVVGGGSTIVRLLPDGVLDPSFGGDGVVAAQSPAGALAIDSAGRIVVGGSFLSEYVFSRYDAGGDLDGSFGDGGVARAPIGDGSGAGLEALAVDGQDRIVAAGMSWSGTFHRFRNFTLARIRGDGGLDANFNGDGTVVENFDGASNSEAFAVTIDPQGRVVAGGYVGHLPHTDTLVARYDENGHPDSSFGVEGKALATFRDHSSAQGLAIDPAGRIVTAGRSQGSEPGSQLSLARFLSDGALDQAFGSGGQVLTAVGASTGANAAAIDGSGRIVVAGPIPYAIGGDTDFAVLRYLPDGSLDGSFGYGGASTTSFGNVDTPTSVGIAAHNGVVAAGSGDNGTDSDFAVARFLGEPDTRAPELLLSGAETQRLARKVRVRVDCDEQCTVEAGGRVTVGDDAGRREVRRLRFALKPAGAELGAGESGVLKPKLSRRELRRIKRKLSRTEATAHAKLTVRATDDAGNEGAARRTVRLRP